jgi:imidazolonepropionase-like amidohydrolase
LPVAEQLARKRPANRALFLCAWAGVALAACRSAPVTIRAGLLLDGRGGQLRDAEITVVDGRITAVTRWRADSVTWDLSRYTVLPGLIDAHVHITGYFNRLGKVNTGGDGETPEQHVAGWAANALATLRAGFTTVASMGAPADRELRKRIDRGAFPGPRILTSLTQIRGAAQSPEELRHGVRRLKSDGADFIKIFASTSVRDSGRPTLSDPQLSALCGEARTLGLRSVVHAQDDASLRQAAAAGCTEVEHGFFASAAGITALAERGVSYDPQCGLVLRNYIENRARYAAVAGFDSAGYALMERMLPVLPGLVRTALATPGLTLLYGTDATAGAHGRNAEDLVCRVREAGQDPMDALVSATSRNAGALGLGDRIGTLAPGYQADLIALEGNPLDQIEAVRRVKFVMKGGKVFLRP